MAAAEGKSSKEPEEFGLFPAEPVPAAQAVCDPARTDFPARSAPVASGSGTGILAREELSLTGSPARSATNSAGGAQHGPAAAQRAADALLTRCVLIR